VLGVYEVSVQSEVQKGIAENARLLLVMPPVAEGRFRDALEELSRLALLRSRPRSIRVIEEEFQA
jgi:homoserine dehydrogenase